MVLPQTHARVLPFILSLIGGSTDTIGFLGLNGLFTAHVTGNIVVLAAHVVSGDPAVLSHILSVPVFVIALLAASVLANHLKRRGVPALQPLMALELVLLATFFALSVSSRVSFEADTLLTVTIGMCGVMAMALQTALVQISLTSTPSTAVMTTNVTQLMIAFSQTINGGDPIAAQKARGHILRLLPVVIGFLVGSALGAAGFVERGLWALAIPTALALVAVLVSFQATAAQ